MFILPDPAGRTSREDLRNHLIFRKVAPTLAGVNQADRHVRVRDTSVLYTFETVQAHAHGGLRSRQHLIAISLSYIAGVTEPAIDVPHKPIIRLATNADVLPMAKVHIMSWRETYPGLLPDPMLARLSIAQEAIRWQRMLDHPRARSGAVAFVAIEHDTIVGYGSCGKQRTELLHDRGFTAEIGELYVLLCAQGQGLGSALLKAMATALVERGHRAMSLWVLEQNARARGFYERLGGTLIAKKRSGLAKVAYGWPDVRQIASGGR